MTTIDTTPVLLTLQLASLTTLLLLVVALPLGWWLAFTRNPLKPLVSTLVTLPLVLPPTVLGFYLLVLLGPQGWVGQIMLWLGLDTLPFTFEGLVLASLIYSLPFAVQPLENAFAAIGRRPLEVAATLGASPWDRFCRIALPLARPGILTAVALTFAHTLGEFGIVLMIGGNIPGETNVMSIAIYDHVENQQYAQAHWLSAGLVVVSFVMLLSLHMLGNPARSRTP